MNGCGEWTDGHSGAPLRGRCTARTAERHSGRDPVADRTGGSCHAGHEQNIQRAAGGGRGSGGAGFLEGALIIGKANASKVATLVARKTWFTMLVRIPYDRSAHRVAKLLAMKMEKLPQFIRKSP